MPHPCVLCRGWTRSPTGLLWAKAVVSGRLEPVTRPDPMYHPLDVARSDPLDAAGFGSWVNLEVLQLPCGLADQDVCTVVLRQHTRLVVEEALRHLSTASRSAKARGPAVLVTGSPGIGKSYSFIPALVRGLARGHAGSVPPAIVVEDRGQGMVVKLRLGASGAITSAHRISVGDFRPDSDPDLRLNTTVYIVDPTSRNGILSSSPVNVAARVVVVCSPNSDHFKDFMKRRPAPHSLYMEPWSLYELVAARPYIDPSVAVDTVVERWWEQGGNPRNVLCTPLIFEAAQNRTEHAIEGFPGSVLERLLHRPHTIRLEEKEVSAPNSAVVAYASAPPFTTPRGVFISNSVLKAVARMYYLNAFHLIDNAAPSERRGIVANTFQEIACEVLAGKCAFSVAAVALCELRAFCCYCVVLVW